MSNHKLEGVRAYLSGAIEYSNDDGIGWRQKIINQIKERNIPLSFIDPCNKGISVQSEIGEDRKLMRELKSQKKFDELRKIMKAIRRWDLRAVDYANMLIVHVDPKVPTWGTPDECVVAERQCKPILAIIVGGVERAPDWLFAIVKPHEMFNNIEECVEYITQINYGIVPMDDRWVIIN